MSIYISFLYIFMTLKLDLFLTRFLRVFKRLYVLSATPAAAHIKANAEQPRVNSVQTPYVRV